MHTYAGDVRRGPTPTANSIHSNTPSQFQTLIQIFLNWRNVVHGLRNWIGEIWPAAKIYENT
jgi:hypothetical protein